MVTYQGRITNPGNSRYNYKKISESVTYDQLQGACMNEFDYSDGMTTLVEKIHYCCLGKLKYSSNLSFLSPSLIVNLTIVLTYCIMLESMFRKIKCVLFVFKSHM